MPATRRTEAADPSRMYLLAIVDTGLYERRRATSDAWLLLVSRNHVDPRVYDYSSARADDVGSLARSIEFSFRIIESPRTGPAYGKLQLARARKSGIDLFTDNAKLSGRRKPVKLDMFVYVACVE